MDEADQRDVSGRLGGSQAWVHARGSIDLGAPRVMGIVNVTPDSFYDGGSLFDGGAVALERALGRCRELVADGADILDIGGESTRPGAEPVSVEAELARVLPVCAALGGWDAAPPISIDTRHAAVAAAVLEVGVAIVNDISCLCDPAMAATVAESGAGLVIGHLRGEPKTMQRTVRFADVLGEVTDELATAVDRAIASGVERSRIVVDPGIGFGKSAEHSATLVAAAGWLRSATGCPVLIGASRKSFLGVLTGRAEADRLPGSLAAALVAVERGASVIRAHDVSETVDALCVAASIRAAFDREAPS